MNFVVADNGALGGFLSVSDNSSQGVETVGPLTGTISGGQSAIAYVSVQPAFASDTGFGSLVGAVLVLNVYTPQAVNYVDSVVTVYILGPYNVQYEITSATIPDNGVGINVGVQYDNGRIQWNPIIINGNGGANVGTSGVIAVSGATPGESYTVIAPAPQGVECTVTSGGSWTFGPQMPVAEIDCEYSSN
jgi:hypothetical protein